MSVQPRVCPEVPEQTVVVARAAFPKGTLAMRVRDELPGLFADEQFASAFGVRGAQLLELAAQRCGRIVFNEWPTGVSVTSAQQHGGPYPATTSVCHTSVGTAAIERFLRPVTYQNAPDALLPSPCGKPIPGTCPEPSTRQVTPNTGSRHRGHNHAATAELRCGRSRPDGPPIRRRRRSARSR
jgi:hypothetical protein